MRALALTAFLFLTACTPVQTGPGEEVPVPHDQDVAHCQQHPQDVFCD